MYLLRKMCKCTIFTVYKFSSVLLTKNLGTFYIFRRDSGELRRKMHKIFLYVFRFQLRRKMYKYFSKRGSVDLGMSILVFLSIGEIDYSIASKHSVKTTQ